MSLPQDIQPRTDPWPSAVAAAPYPEGGLENRVQILALLLRLALHLPALIPALLPALWATLFAGLAARPRRARGPWYLSEAAQDSMERMPPHRLRAARRLIAMVGWLLAGHRRRGARPRPRGERIGTPAIRPALGSRAPPRAA